MKALKLNFSAVFLLFLLLFGGSVFGQAQQWLPIGSPTNPQLCPYLLEHSIYADNVLRLDVRGRSPLAGIIGSAGTTDTVRNTEPEDGNRPISWTNEDTRFLLQSEQGGRFRNVRARVHNTNRTGILYYNTGGTRNPTAAADARAEPWSENVYPITATAITPAKPRFPGTGLAANGRYDSTALGFSGNPTRTTIPLGWNSNNGPAASASALLPWTETPAAIAATTPAQIQAAMAAAATATNAAQILPPGHYNGFTLGWDPKIIRLRAGTYHFWGDVFLDGEHHRVIIEPDASGSYRTTIYISGQFRTGNTVRIGPADFANFPAIGTGTVPNDSLLRRIPDAARGQILIVVAGTGSIPIDRIRGRSSAAVHIGWQSRILGTLIVPNGGIYFQSGTNIFGQLLANEVMLNERFDGGNLIYDPIVTRNITATIPVNGFPRPQCGTANLSRNIEVILTEPLPAGRGATLTYTVAAGNATGHYTLNSGIATIPAGGDRVNIPFTIIGANNVPGAPSNGWHPDVTFNITFTGYNITNQDPTNPVEIAFASTYPITISTGTQQFPPSTPTFAPARTNLYTGTDGTLRGRPNTQGFIFERPGTEGSGATVTTPQTVGTVSSSGSGVAYDIVSGDPNNWFELNSTTGVITTTANYNADYENTAQRQITLGIRARIGANPDCVRDAVSNVTINILPWNDNIMTFRGAGETIPLTGVSGDGTTGVPVNTGAATARRGVINVAINESQTFTFNGRTIVVGDSDQPGGDNLAKVVGLSTTALAGQGNNITVTNGGTVAFSGDNITFTAANNITGFVNNRVERHFYYTIRDTATYGYNTAHFDLLVRVNVTINAVSRAQPEPQNTTIYVCERGHTTIGIVGPVGTTGVSGGDWSVRVEDTDVVRGMTGFVYSFVNPPFPTATLGSISIQQGRIVYTLPNTSITGTTAAAFQDVISYQITKGNGLTGSGTINVRIRPVNTDAIQVQTEPYIYTFSQSANKTGNILRDVRIEKLNRVLPIGTMDTLIVNNAGSVITSEQLNYRIERIVGEPLGGVDGLTLYPDGRFVFAQIMPGTYEFTYRLRDVFTPDLHTTGGGATLVCANPPSIDVPGTIRIIITPENTNPPTAQGDVTSVNENQPVPINVINLVDDEDLRRAGVNEVLDITIDRHPNRGTAAVSGGYVVKGEHGGRVRNPIITYTHGLIDGEFDYEIEFPFRDTIIYRVTDRGSGNDGLNGRWATAMLIIDINPVNDNDPVAVDSTISVLFKGADNEIRVPGGCSDKDELVGADLGNGEWTQVFVTDFTPLTFHIIDSVSHPDIRINGLPVPAGGLEVSGEVIVVFVAANSDIPSTNAWIAYRIVDEPDNNPRISETKRITFLAVEGSPEVPGAGTESVVINEDQNTISTFLLHSISTPSPELEWIADNARLWRNGDTVALNEWVNTQFGRVRLGTNGRFEYEQDGEFRNFNGIEQFSPNAPHTLTDRFDFVVQSRANNPEVWSYERNSIGRINITVNPRNNHSPVIHRYHFEAFDTIPFNKNANRTVLVIGADYGTHSGARITDTDVATNLMITNWRAVCDETSVRCIVTDIRVEILETGKSINVSYTGEMGTFRDTVVAKIAVEISDPTPYCPLGTNVNVGLGAINVIHSVWDTIIVKIIPVRTTEPRPVDVAPYYLPENDFVNITLTDLVIDEYDPQHTNLQFRIDNSGRYLTIGDLTPNADGSYRYTQNGLGIERFKDSIRVEFTIDGTFREANSFVIPLRIYPRNDEKPQINGTNPRVFTIDEDQILNIGEANGIRSWITDADIYPNFDENWNYVAGDYQKDRLEVWVIDENNLEVAADGRRFNTNNGFFVIRSDGSFTYTPTGDAAEDEIRVFVKDFAPANLPYGGSGEEGLRSDIIRIRVIINELPFAVDDVLAINEGATGFVNLITNNSNGTDYNPDSTRWILTAVRIIGEAQFGTIAPLENNVFTYTNIPSLLTGTQTHYTEILEYEMIATAEGREPVITTARITITITANPPTADDSRAFYTDENADGRVDRVTIPFDREINRMVTNFEVRFGGMTTPNVTSQYARNEDGSENRNVVILSGFNAPENTTGGIMGITIEYTNFGTSQTISPTDRAAPVVTNARYTRVPGGNDTLVLRMSELISDENIVIADENLPFYFVRDRGVFPRDSFNISFERHWLSDGEYTFVIDLKDSAKISLNDSVFINWEATPVVRDNSDNRQTNPANKKVPISFRTATPIYSATYFSRSNPANGWIDLIEVNLGMSVEQDVAEEIVKALVLSNTEHRRFTKGDTITLTATGFRFNVTEVRRHTGPNTGLLAEDTVSITTPLVLNGGQLTINPSTVKAIDRVAPVIIRAIYNWERMTLDVEFSESVAEHLITERDGKPYLFWASNPRVSRDSAEYKMYFRVTNPTKIGTNVLRYEVDSTGIQFPVNGDSIWIDVGGIIRDTEENVQMNRTVRAPLFVEPKYPDDVELYIFPNPLQMVKHGKSNKPNVIDPHFLEFYGFAHLGVQNGSAILVDAKSPDIIDLSGRVKIIDQTGNVVSEDIEMITGQSGRGTISAIAIWDGKNRSGRNVGAASYLAIIQVEIKYRDSEEPRSYRRIIVVSSGHH